MATGALFSLEEYLSTTYDPDCEYVDGELLERNIGESEHAGLQGIILGLLYSRRREWGIHVFPELRVQVCTHSIPSPGYHCHDEQSSRRGAARTAFSLH